VQKIKLDATLGGVTVWKGSLTDWKQLPEATEAEVAYKLKVWAVINKTRKNFHLGNQQPRASGVGLEAKPESVERMERKKRQPAQAPARSSAPKRRATGTTTMKRRVTDEVAKIIGMPPEAACNYVDRVHGNPKVAEILAGSKTVVSACEKRLLVTIVDGAVKWSEVRDERGGRSVLCAQEAIGQSKALANILALGRQGCDDPIGVEAAQGMLRVSSRLQKEATKLLDGVYNNATKEIALGLLRKRRGRKTRPEDALTWSCAMRSCRGSRCAPEPGRGRGRTRLVDVRTIEGQPDSAVVRRASPFGSACLRRRCSWWRAATPRWSRSTG